MKKTAYTRFTFGYTFEKNKEAISLIFINYFLTILFAAVLILIYVENEGVVPLTYRYHTIVFLFLINIILLRFHFLLLPKMILLFIMPFLLLILPPLAGMFDDEFYFWFPYLPVGLSILAHFILNPQKEKYFLYTTLLLYFLLTILIDNIMIDLCQADNNIIRYVEENRFYYNLIPALIFIFSNFALGILFRQNARYEKQLHTHKLELEEQNRELDIALKELHSTQSQLLQSEKLAALGTLSSALAHEINNPLTFISVAIDQIHSELENFDKSKSGKTKEGRSHTATIKKLLKYAEEGSSRTAEIVKKLGSLKSVRNQTLKPLDLRSLVESVFLLVRTRQQANIQLINDIKVSMSVDCEKEKLQRVFYNIVSNALDELESENSNEKRVIRISANKEVKEEAEYVNILIFNNGPGIADEDLKNIFDPFFSRSKARDSMGLGLSEAFTIITDYKGMLTAYNTPEGVNFSISLPIKKYTF